MLTTTNEPNICSDLPWGTIKAFIVSIMFPQFRCFCSANSDFLYSQGDYKTVVKLNAAIIYKLPNHNKSTKA